MLLVPVNITNVSLNLNEMSIYKENATAVKLNLTVQVCKIRKYYNCFYFFIFVEWD